MIDSNLTLILIILLVFTTGCADGSQCLQAKSKVDNLKVYTVSCTNTNGAPEAPGSSALQICSAHLLAKQPSIAKGASLNYNGDFTFNNIGDWSQIYLAQDSTPYYVRPTDIQSLC